MAEEPVRGKESERRLTEKQEAFVLAYVQTNNATQAYRSAFGTTASDESVSPRASRLLKSEAIQARLEQLKSKVASKVASKIDAQADKVASKVAEVAGRPLQTMADIAVMLVEDRQLAHAEGDAKAATEATMSLAKLLGHYVEKKNVTSDNRHTHAAGSISPFADFLTGAIGPGAKGEAEEPLQN